MMKEEEIFTATGNSWRHILEEEYEADYFIKLKEFLRREMKEQGGFFPSPGEIFSALEMTPFEKVKVVILGQDPYHGPGQAHGLCFSVKRGIKKPPSLRNILKELQADIGIPVPDHGNLENWARQGVLLLNATLTVRANMPGSHQKKGWEIFTDSIIRKLSAQKESLVFLLWGNYAREKQKLINQEKHYILTAAHPSPLSASRGFFGCRHFSSTNNILKSLNKKTIDWRLQ